MILVHYSITKSSAEQWRSQKFSMGGGLRDEAPKARESRRRRRRGRKFLDFLYQNGDFCAFWVALFIVYLKLFYMQNGTFGLPKLKVTAAFALAKIERDRERKGKTEIKVLVKYVDLLYDRLIVSNCVQST